MNCDVQRDGIRQIVVQQFLARKVKKTMKRAVVVASDYRLMSALVGNETARTLSVGDRVEVQRDLELDDGALPSGERGSVVSVDAGEHGHGYVEILFDRPIPALHEWRNVLLLVPFDTPDWIDGLSLASCFEAKEIKIPPRVVQPRPKRRALAAAIVLVFLTGWLLDPPKTMVLHVGKNIIDLMDCIGPF